MELVPEPAHAWPLSSTVLRPDSGAGGRSGSRSTAPEAIRCLPPRPERPSQHILPQGMPSLSRSSLPPQGQFCRYQRASSQLTIRVQVRRGLQDQF